LALTSSKLSDIGRKLINILLGEKQMMKTLQWLWDNKTWLFSGIGVIILGFLVRALAGLFKKPSQGATSQTQKAKAGTSVLQAGRDINLNVGPQPQPLPALKVLAHRAYFIGNPEEHYFIKVVNITPGADIEVTHVWYKNGHRVDVLSRPLPVRLRPSEIWETYVATSIIPHDAEALQHFHALISTGEVFGSEHNKEVPPTGYLAGR
jgi:hypothetical protein